jgi:hypothetical protein
MAIGSNTAVKVKDDAIRFEIRDGMRRVSCVVLNEALEAAAGLPQLSAPMLRRRSFDRFRTLIHAAAGARLAAVPGFVGPIVLTSGDLRSVPPERGAPVFGSSGRPSPRPAHPGDPVSPDAAPCHPAS